MRRKIHIDNGAAEPEDSAAEDETTMDSEDAADPLEAQDGPAPEELAAEAGRLEAAEAEIEALRAQVAALEKQHSEERDKHLRTLADFQNFRRRNEEQRGELQQFANRELILGLLPALDNFERALNAAEKSQSYEALVGGVALTLRQLQDFLQKNGVEAIESVGQEFDPNFHEAVQRVEDSEHPENTVVEEVQRGYKMHNRVIRPSMVKVAVQG